MNKKDFWESHKLSNLITEPTFYKLPAINLSSIDLILTNCPQSFHSSGVIETGTSHFHKITVSTMKSNFQKLKLKVTFYRDFRNFSNERFGLHLAASGA